MNKQNEVLKIDKLTKYYKCQHSGLLSPFKSWVGSKYDTGIENISFALFEGEILGVTGKEQCGKTTILKLLAGQMKAESGNIQYKGSTYSPDQLKKVVNYIQLSEITPNLKLSLMENLLQNLAHSDDRGKIIDKAEEVLEYFNIKEYAFREYKIIPHEVKGMLTLLLSLINTKPILCHDQPFFHLHGIHKNKYLNEIKNLSSTGTSIIITSKSRDELDLICDRIIEI